MQLRLLPRHLFFVSAALLCAISMPNAASASIVRPNAKVLSASWGTDNAVGCPTGEKGLDNIPVTFNWFIRRSSIARADFRILRSDGSVAIPTCALQFPPDEFDERQTVNLIGDFGDAVNGPRPVGVRVVGELQGKAPRTARWKRVPLLPSSDVERLSGGPFIVDAWTLTAAIYRGDANRCKTGKTFVRVMWSNGLTAFPTGDEIGASVVASYRAKYKLPGGKVVAIAPRAVADLNDHPNVANADNMHDLCLPEPPRGARLVGVTVGRMLIQDPNRDPNRAQKFRVG